MFGCWAWAKEKKKMTEINTGTSRSVLNIGNLLDSCCSQHQFLTVGFRLAEMLLSIITIKVNEIFRRAFSCQKPGRKGGRLVKSRGLPNFRLPSHCSVVEAELI